MSQVEDDDQASREDFRFQRQGIVAWEKIREMVTLLVLAIPLREGENA